nr:uncharacterized protein LOC109741133 [Aegilops tauschii subsp. strangulata]
MAAETSTQGRQGKETTEELLARLNLQEEEDDAFVWEEELPDLREPAKWLAIARVHTTRTFSPNALYGDMRAAWNPAKTIVWRKIKENLFTAQFGCLGDWNKAMAEGPWLFRDQAVIMVEYDGFKNPDSIKLDKLAVWAQIHRLPDNFLIEPAVRGMALRIGEVEEVQLKLPAGFFGEFVRVRVKIDINAKIRRFVTGKKGDEMVRYQVKYEKLPIFCYNCGKLGEVAMAFRGDEVAQDLREEEAGEESNITQTKVGVSMHNRTNLADRMVGRSLSQLRVIRV